MINNVLFDTLRTDIEHYEKLLEMELRKPPQQRSRDRIRSYRESIRSMKYSLAEVAGATWINDLERWVMKVSHVEGH